MKRTTHTFGVIFMIVLILLLATVTEVILVFRLTTRQTMESGSNRLAAIGGQLEDTINQAKNETMHLAIEVQPFLDDPKALERLIRAKKQENYDATGGICFNTYIAGEDWYIVPDLEEMTDFVPSQRTWYTGAVRSAGEPCVSDPYIDVLTGNFCYTVSVLLQDQHTVVATDYTMDTIQQHIRRMHGNGNQDAVIVTAEGIIAGCTDESLIGESLVRAMPDYAGIFSLARTGEGVVTYTHSGKNLFATRSGFGWYLIVVENSWTLYRTTYVQIGAMLIISLLVFAVVIVMYLVSMHSTRKAEDALAYKEAFLERITTELQEPLHRILSTASPENLRSCPDPDEEFAVIRDAGRKLSDRIGQIVSYTSLMRSESRHKEQSSPRIVRNSHIRGIILAALMVVMGISLYINTTSTIRYGRGMMQKSINDYEYQLNEWINTQKSILDMFCSIISTNPEMLEDYEGTVRYLDAITRQYPEISVSYMTNPELEHTVYMNNGWQPGEAWNVEDREWYKETLASETGWNISSPYYDAQTGLYCVTFSERVYDARTGDFLGNFGIDFYMDKLVDILGSSYTGGSYAFLADASGQIINHPYGKYQMTEEGATNVVELSYNIAEPDGESIAFLRDYDNSYRVLIAARNETSNFTIYVLNEPLSLFSNVLIYGGLCFLAMILCTVLVYRLLTGLMQLQDEANRKYRESAKAAIAADAAKTTFLAQMSHEIRTPINVVLGMNEMILRESRDHSIREYAVNIRSAGRTLLSLINSILDFSKIEDGKMEIIPAEYDTAGMIQDLVTSIRSRAEAKGLEFIVCADPALPTTLCGDDVRIKQVILNLLTNAVKYTENGRVTFIIRSEKQENDQLDLYVEVTDTGIGIRSEDIGAMFDSFKRLDVQRNRNIEGTGLGMSIVTKLLEMMHSELHVESEYGSGSSFSFLLQQGIIDSTPMGNYNAHLNGEPYSSETSTLHAPDARVLVVDDNEMNLRVAENMLRVYGIVPDLASSGFRALEKMREKKYHIVFLDHMMPRMDGIETLHRMQDEHLTQNTIVIALTANAVVGAREIYYKAGFDDYISKPIESRILEKRLAFHLPVELVGYRDNSEPPMEEAPASPTPQADLVGEDQFTAAELHELWEKAPGLNVMRGLRFCMDSKSFYQEALQMFVESDKREALGGFLAAGDMEQYRIAVHSLKSTALTIGAELLSDHAKAQEMAAKAGDAQTVAAHHEALMEEYGTLLQGIQAILA